MEDRIYLIQAMELAKESAKVGCFPAGAVIVNADGEVLSSGRNTVKQNINRIHHAEVNAILHSKTDFIQQHATLYTTLEPCFMCMGAALINQINRIVWLVNDYWAGGVRLYDKSTPYFQKADMVLHRFEDSELIKISASLIAGYFKGRNDNLVEKILGEQLSLANSCI